MDAPRQEGRTLPVEAQTTLRAAQGEGGRTQRLAGTQVPGAAAGPSKEKAAVDWIVLEPRRERTGAPSEVMIGVAIRDNPATGVIRACHLPGPGVVAGAAIAAVREAEVEAVADAADNRPGTAQPLFERRKYPWCFKTIMQK